MTNEENSKAELISTMSPKVGRKLVLGLISLLAMSLSTTSCSVQQIEVSSDMTRATAVDDMFVLQNEVTMKASRAAPTTLKAGTRWFPAGSIEQGTVYDTEDQVVIVNSFNVHEASIVVDNQTIVGYYLVVEKTFVETAPVDINFIEER